LIFAGFSVCDFCHMTTAPVPARMTPMMIIGTRTAIGKDELEPEDEGGDWGGGSDASGGGIGVGGSGEGGSSGGVAGGGGVKGATCVTSTTRRLVDVKAKPCANAVAHV
jgi:hypothetical protein